MLYASNDANDDPPPFTSIVISTYMSCPPGLVFTRSYVVKDEESVLGSNPGGGNSETRFVALVTK